MAAGPIDMTYDQLSKALKAWDFTPAYPAAFLALGGDKSVLTVPGWPYDIIENMITESNGVMTRAVCSIIINGDDEPRALGDHLGPGAGSLQRFGTRWVFTARISAWADQAMGGADTVTKMFGQVYGCFFFNRMRLSIVKLTKVASGTREAFQDREQLWRYDTLVDGYAVMNYDA